MKLEMPHKRERGQVGIGTLIVFIAMVLVAAIAAGVLINTAGFLQSQSEQTGEESSAQVTNQLQVIGTTGIVSGGEGSSAGLVTLGGDVPVDSEDTVDVTFTSTGQGEVLLSSSGSSSADIAVSDGDALELVRVNDSTVRVTNTNSGSSIEFDSSNDLQVNDNGDGTPGDDTIRFDYTFSDSVFGETTLQSSTVTDDGSTITIEAEDRTESFLQIEGASSGNNLIISDGEEVTVSDASGDLANGDGNTLSLSADDTLTFSPDTDSEEFTVTNENTGSTITVGAEGTLKSAAGTGSVALDADGDTATVGSADTAFVKTDSRYLFTRELTTGNAIAEVNILVASSPGADDIDMTQTVIDMNSPSGSFQLTYGEETIENDQFAINAVQDEDGTVPVLTSGDRFNIIIDPGRLDTGTTTELELTTPSGATKSLLVRVPDSLANQEAVSL